MPLDRALLDAHVAKMNAARRGDQAVRVAAHEADRFTLAFPNRSLPDGQCIDQDFTEIQWALHEGPKLLTSIVGGRHDEGEDVYFVDYEVVTWD